MEINKRKTFNKENKSVSKRKKCHTWQSTCVCQNIKQAKKIPSCDKS